MAESKDDKGMGEHNFPFPVLQLIQSYLPYTDLVACTKVSRHWEAVARAHLLNQKSKVILRNRKAIYSYMSFAKGWGRSHKAISIILRKNSQKSGVSFAKRYGKDIVDLELYFDIDEKMMEKSAVPIGFLKPFSRLQVLRLAFDFGEGFIHSGKTFNSLFASEEVILSTVKKMKITCVEQFMNDISVGHLGRGLLPRLFQLCPNVSTLLLQDYGAEFLIEIGNTPELYKNITCLRMGQSSDIPIPFRKFPALPQLTRLEFVYNLSYPDHFDCWVTALMKHYAVSLKQLQFRSVGTSISGELEVITIPIMPKLEILEITVSKFLDIGYEDRVGALFPDVEFLFEALKNEQTKASDFKLQFPSLTNIRITSPSYKDVGFECEDDEEEKEYRGAAFEAVARLWDTLLPLSSDLGIASTTVINVETDRPPQKSFREPVFCICECDEIPYHMVDSKNFCKRLARAFPNLKTEWLVPYCMEVGQENIHRFLEIGDTFMQLKDVRDKLDMKRIRQVNSKLSILLGNDEG